MAEGDVETYHIVHNQDGTIGQRRSDGRNPRILSDVPQLDVAAARYPDQEMES